MCDQMQARGPDAVGYWSDRVAGIFLGHRRLAILDLDSRSDQPMVSDDGRYVAVLNGEIYNFQDLRRTLEHEGVAFRTEGDTELLLALYRRGGKAMLSELRGMFAFAIWDRKTQTVFLARDPYGIKPLYIARINKGWLFASQVRALIASGLVSRELDPLGQMGFWLLGSVPEPRTWFRDISAVASGSWCRISANGDVVEPHTYWDIGDCWREAPESRLSLPEMQGIVRAGMSSSVRQHLVSDVPVCLLLSGGVDSGSIAGQMQDLGCTGTVGITLGFGEFRDTELDEAPIAAEVAMRYGISHHVRLVSRLEFEADLPRILAAMDQPSVDGINTWYASKAVSELGFKAVLSGVGGDELFFGYPSFDQIPALIKWWSRLPSLPGVRMSANLASNLLATVTGNPRWRWLPRQAGSLYGAYWLRRGLFSPDELPTLMGEHYVEAVQRHSGPDSLVAGMVGVLPGDPKAAVGQMESLAYLRNQLLRDSDWASMDHGVELRTPLVDAWLLKDLMPLLRSFADVSGKALLARSPTRPLPIHIVDRRKTGFGIPVQSWQDGASPSTRAERGNRGWACRLAAAYTENYA